MDQINVFKGYDKVTHLENQNQNQPPSKPNHKSILAIISISAVVLSTIIIGLIIIGTKDSTVDKSSSNSPSSSSSLTVNFTDSIKLVCNVTRYPDSCFTSLISFNNSTSSPQFDPELILKLSLQVSFNELSKLSGWLKNLTLNGEAALEDCESQIEDAIGRVNDSKMEMETVKPGDEILNEREISDIQTWMSSALTDQESCLDGLEEMDSNSSEEVKVKMRKSMEFVSNSLAIIANIQLILQKFNMPLH